MKVFLTDCIMTYIFMLFKINVTSPSGTNILYQTIQPGVSFYNNRHIIYFKSIEIKDSLKKFNKLKVYRDKCK